MRDKMMFYGVTLGQRHSTKQKELFLDEVIKECEKNGFKTEFMTKHDKINHVCNLVIGDLKKARKIVCASYDTPSKAVNPFYSYYPFNPKLNVKEESKNLILEVIIGALLLVVCYFILVYTLKGSTLMKVMGIAASAIIVIYCVFFLFKGRANKVNFNRNSAGVALVMHMVENVKSQDTAYVLYDKASDGYEGLKLLKENIGDDQLVILLDAVSYGEKTVVAHNGADVSKLLKDGWIDKKYDETDNTVGYFNRCIMISRGSVINHRFTVKGTRSKADYHFDYDGLNEIYQQLKSFVEE